MRTRLLRLYWAMVAPAIVAFTGLYVAVRLGLADAGPWAAAHPWVGPALFVAAAVLGIAAPLALRTAFVYGHREARSIPEQELERFERTQMLVALWTPYLAVAAAFLELPTVLFAGTVLAAFYALYYFYPSQRRIVYERRIFRVR